MSFTIEDALHNLKTLFKNSPFAMFVLNKEAKVLLWNKAAETLFNWTEEEVKGKPLQIIPEIEEERFQNLFTSIMSGKTITALKSKRMKKDGSLIDVFIQPLPWYDENKNIKGYLAILYDLTIYNQLHNSLQDQQKKVESITYFDYLTGLPNRKYFEEQLAKKLENAKKTFSYLVLFFLDLDGFKYINDTLGHEVGDQLLKEVVLRLQLLRENTSFVSRLGGDEFAIIITDMNDIREMNGIAKDYLQLFEAPFYIGSHELFITTSIGISVFPDSGSTNYNLIKYADLAMYRAKDEGKNRFEIFFPDMNINTYKKFSLQNDLRKAIQHNDIFLLYQPRIDSKTNEIIGAEALARWTHPKWGIVSPLEFISLAEELGLINALGEKLLLNACQENKKWQDNGLPPIRISVNFSALQFSDENIVETVEEVLLQSGLEPKWLEIEITETVVLKNESSILSKLEKLKSRGISIAIDDFGTGYSALSYLKKIKPDTVKIDKSFIQQIPADNESTEITTAIIKLFQKLNINVVAEGVETTAQWIYLRDNQCNELQGYLFSKPVSAEEFQTLLKKNHTSLFKRLFKIKKRS